jgi:hypothetical protein
LRGRGTEEIASLSPIGDIAHHGRFRFVFLPEVALLRSRDKHAPSTKLEGEGIVSLALFSGLVGHSVALDFPDLTGKTAKRRSDAEILLVREGRFR